VRGRIAAWLRTEWQSVHGLPAARPFSFEPPVVLASAAALLTLMHFHGTAAELGRILGALERGPAVLASVASALFRGPWFELASYAFWALACCAGYLVIPALLLRVLRPGEPLSSFGLAWSGLRGHARIYVLLFLATLPLVLLASTRPAFLGTYPFYRLAARSPVDFLAWEALYALQFVCLEFFFRGFLLHSLKRDLGAYAIFVSVVPYCMIHFQKPLPEALGAIVAGIVLGTLSLRTGSVLGGAAVHVAVAVTMDLLALVQKSG
jgi:CAAX protease family protein